MMKTDAHIRIWSKIIVVLLLGFALMPARANGAKLELVSAGLIELDDVDYTTAPFIKAMYPVVAADQLVFLIVNERTGREGDIIYSVPLGDILSRKSRIPRAKILSIKSERMTFDGHVHKLFYSIYNDGTSVKQTGSTTTLVDAVGTLSELRLGDQNSSQFPPRDFKRKQNSWFKGFWLEEKILKENKKIIFECGDPISFSERKRSKNKRALIVNYFDRQNVPRLTKIPTPRNDCGKDLLTGLEPHISPGGKKFSFLRVNDQNRDQNDLYVYNYKNLNMIHKIRNVKLYDIKIHDFKYKKSISWIKDKNKEFLYYIPNRPQNRVIGRIDCAKSCGRIQKLKVPSCFYLDRPIDPENWKSSNDESLPGVAPIVGWLKGKEGNCIGPGTIGRPVLAVDEVIWAVPFIHNGHRYIASQAVVMSSLRETEDEGPELQLQESWAPRILILRSKQ